MALIPRLEARQTQNLALTPQLMQSIRLLQLSHLELSAFVDTELLRNPLLERDEGAPETGADTEVPVERGYEELALQSDSLEPAGTVAGNLDTDAESLYPEQSRQDAPDLPTGYRRDIGHGGAGGEAPDLEQYVSARESLGDHLAEQVAFLVSTPAERMIARHLIDSLDEAGYLATDCAAIAEQLGTTPETVEAVLAKVQACDPPGVFARSLKECLELQLRDRDRLDPMMARLLDNLDLVAGHDLATLQKRVGADREDVVDMLAELRRLDPRPGRAFDGAPVQALVPDVFVRPGPDGGWRVELNTDVLPRVLVDRTYYATIAAKTRDPEEKAFIIDCLQTGNWLVKSLDQRAQTILKVALEIVRQQDDFLVNGVAHLHPMTLKMVAEAIDMHESTVSRVTSNKYIATPRGTFEMKYFFTTALGSTSGDAEHSAEAVRHRIRQLIDAEAPNAILSDDSIAETLKREQGIDVARRTVAKYREAMNIPSSVVRRRQKKSLATAG